MIHKSHLSFILFQLTLAMAGTASYPTHMSSWLVKSDLPNHLLRRSLSSKFPLQWAVKLSYEHPVNLQHRSRCKHIVSFASYRQRQRKLLEGMVSNQNLAVTCISIDSHCVYMWSSLLLSASCRHTGLTLVIIRTSQWCRVLRSTWAVNAHRTWHRRRPCIHLNMYPRLAMHATRWRLLQKRFARCFTTLQSLQPAKNTQNNALFWSTYISLTECTQRFIYDYNKEC